MDRLFVVREIPRTDFLRNGKDLLPGNKITIFQNVMVLDFKDNTKSRTTQFLGTFAKLRKATISFVMSVRPSLLM
jgi:hypothetical protein